MASSVSLFTRHPLVLQTSFSEVKRQAAEQELVLVGTPGSVGVREVNGSRFYYRQYYDPQGKKRAEYVGPVAEAGAEERVAALRSRIEVTNALVKDARLLAQRGYARVDTRTNAIVASLANHGIFRGGGLLVGSHAYGALLNELGVRAAAFTTEDVDVARGEPLDIATTSGEVVSFAQMLADSTIPLQPVPSLKRTAPSTSYKPPGADRLRVDLLVPARGREITTRAVPELKAHATALPHLAYVLEAPIDAAILGRESVVAVRVPRPEVLAWHKMLVSQLRRATSEKKNKDLDQAAVLFAVLAEDAPESLREALDAVPKATRTQTMTGARMVLRRLLGTPHGRGREMLGELVAR